MDLDLFKKNSNENKDRPGIIFRHLGNEMSIMTYGEITGAAEILQDRWKNLLSPHSCVGLLMGHNIYIPSIIISISNANCSFIFLKADIDELKQAIKDLNIQYILHSTFDFEGDLKCEFSNYSKSFEIISSSILELESKNSKQEIIKHQIHLDVLKQEDFSTYSDINYIIKTSGTTGKIKYVNVYNYCIKANIDSLRSIFGITSSDLIYFGTPLTFDPSIVELYLALSSGSCLLITSSETRSEPKLLIDTLFPELKYSQHVTFIQMVPSVFLRWSQNEIDRIISGTNLRILALGGEVFPSKRIFERKNPNLKIFNLYGITEVSCWSTCFNIVDNFETHLVPLGEPLAETFIKLKNEKGEDSNEGEICIGSFKRFCDILQIGPSADSKELRKTGDLGYYLNGHLFYSGRKNNTTIKRNGQRLNLLEIERKIFELINIHSVCVWVTNKNRPNYLAAALLLNNVSEKSMDKIRIRLLTNLQPNSMPNYLFQMLKFPLTSNGKLDRKALEEKVKILLNNVSKKIDTDKDLVLIFHTLWTKYLCTNLQVDENKNFYEMGGDSIKRMEFINELKHSLEDEALNFFKRDSSFLFYCSYKKICQHLRELRDNLTNRITDVEVLPTFNDAKREKEQMKYLWEMSVKWKYEMLACVDSTAVFQKMKDSTFLYVIIGSFSHKLAILNTYSGEEIFSLMLPDAIENEASNFMDGSNIFVGCFDGKLYCISLKDYSIKWSFGTEDRIKNKPCKFGDEDDMDIIFGSYDRFLYCLKSKNGSLKWKTKLNGSIITSPCIVSDGNNKPLLIAITNKGTVIRLDPKNGIQISTYEVNAPVFGAPIYDDGNKEKRNIIVYGDVKGIVHVHFIEENAENIIKTLQSGSAIYGSPAIIPHSKETKRTVVICCENGRLCFLDVDTSTEIMIQKELRLETRISTTPFYDKLNNILVVSANNGSIFLIDPETAYIVGEFKLPDECFSSPVIENNSIFVGCRDNNFYCLHIRNVQIYRN